MPAGQSAHDESATSVVIVGLGAAGRETGRRKHGPSSTPSLGSREVLER
jgi:hypothetical protein